MGERSVQSLLRLPHLREWAGLHVARERARVPSHAVAQRSRHGCERRGILRARRSVGTVLVTVATAPARRGVLHLSPRIRIQRLRARRGRYRHRADGVRRPRHRDQVHGLEGTQRIGARAATFGDRLRGMGAWGPATQNHHACGYRDRSGQRRGVCPQCLPSGIRRQRRLPGRGRHGPNHQRRPHGVHRTQRLAAQSGSACASAPLRQGGCGHGPLHGHSGSVRARGRAIARAHLSHGRGSRSRGRQSIGAASTASPALRAQRSRP